MNKTDILVNHWDTWVTEEDLRNLSNAGLTHVRIPIGYWMLMDQQELDRYQEPYITGDWPYLVRAIHWATKYNLKGNERILLNIVVIVDMHSAPGSQNPWQHSYEYRNANLFSFI